MNIEIELQICAGMCVLTYTLTRKQQNSSKNEQRTLLLKTTFHQEELGLFEEVADSTTKAEKVKMNFQKKKELLREAWGCVKRIQSQLQEPPIIRNDSYLLKSIK
jgi:hypothetical protein